MSIINGCAVIAILTDLNDDTKLTFCIKSSSDSLETEFNELKIGYYRVKNTFVSDLRTRNRK